MTFDLAKLIASKIDVDTAKTFVKAAKAVVDATLIVAQESRPEAPSIGAYPSGELTVPTTAPIGGWLSRSDVHNYAKAMTEALRVENWVEGVANAIMLMSLFGAI